MKRNKKIISFLLLFCLLAGVGNVSIPGMAKTPKVKVKKVAVKAPYSKKMTLQKGQTATLKVKVTVTPNKKAYKKVTYKSSKTKVVTVSKKGVIKAKKTGSAKITVTSTKNKKKKVVIQVTVVNKASSQPTPTPQPTTAPTPAAPVDNYFTLYGTFLKTGNYKTKLTGIDEAGNTFIHTLYFGIYDEKSLAAAIDDAYFYLPSGTSQVNIGQLMAVGGGSGSYLYEIGKNDWGISVNSGGWSSGYLEKEGVYPLSVTVTDANNPELKTSVSWTVYVENGATITLAVKNSKGEGINDVLIQFLPKKCTPGLGIDEKIFGIDEIQNGNYKASLPKGTYDVMITRAKSNSYAFLSNVKITADGQKLPDVVLNI